MYSVERKQDIVTVNSSGLKEVQGFQTLDEAILKHVIKLPNSRHAVNMLMEGGINMQLHRGYNSPEGDYLTFTTATRQITVPRYTASINGEEKPGVAVSTAHNRLEIGVRVEDYNSQVFDRGLAWINVTNPAQAELKFVVLPKPPVEPVDLLNRSRRMEERAYRLIAQVLEGRFPL